jgi:hypothetical protein
MANGRFETIPTTLELDDAEKHNRNWRRADSDLSLLQQQITAETQARIAADNEHASAAVAHTADQIQYAPGQSIKQKVDDQQAQITNIIAGPAPSAEEVIDARRGADGVVRTKVGDLIREIQSTKLNASAYSSLFILAPNNAITASTPPNALPYSQPFVTGLVGADMSGFPDYGTLITFVGSGDDVASFTYQVLYAKQGLVTLMRKATSATTWSSWTTIWSGESGSNANGNYIRFGDGTQICYGSQSVTLASSASQGALFYQTSPFVSFPAAFTQIPSVLFQTDRGEWIYTALSYFDLNGFTPKHFFVQQVTNFALTFRWVAIGRWK